MVEDAYITISKPATGEYKEKGSKFMAFAFPFCDEKEIDVRMADLKTIHPKARHYCYAYKLGMDNNRFRVNDDNEPSGTAGKPIYGQILSHGLTNIIIIVIRYFGGTKLGVSGLKHAYKEAARQALDSAITVEKFLTKTYTLRFQYDHMGQILNALKELNIDIQDKSFEVYCMVVIEMRLSVVDSMMLMFKSKVLNKGMDEIQSNTEIPFCKIIDT